MYTLCTTEKTTRQQNTFEQVFLQMLLEDDYDNITISDLCRRAGLSRKIFYRLFERKADVLYSLIDHTLILASDYILDESREVGEIHRFFAFWRTQKDLLDVLLKHQNSGMLTDRAVRYILKEQPDFVHLFGADSGKYGFETIVFYITGIFSLVVTWHNQDYRYSLDEISAILMNLLSTIPIKNPLHP